jgi:hypothetical protein
MKTIKPILIGAGILAVIGGVFFIVDVLNKYKTKKIIPVKKYQDFMSKANNMDLWSFLNGKNAYTLANNVNVRATPEVNNAFIKFGEPTGGLTSNNNITGTIPKKGTYIGKVGWVKKDNTGKTWLGIIEGDGNPYISKVFNWDARKNTMSGSQPPYTVITRNNSETKPIRWVRSDVVVVDLSDERTLKDAYSDWNLKEKYTQ